MASMKTLRFPKGELTEEQEALITEAGQAHGITVQMRDSGDLTVCNLTPEQFYALAHGVEEHWGIPYNGIKCIPVDE